MKTTCHSEVDKIETIFIKRVEDAFISKEKIEQEWQSLNFLSPPEFESARKEYDDFESMLRGCDIEIKHFPSDELLSLDSMYCRDASIVTNAGVILCNMGKPTRRLEPESQARMFEAIRLKVLGRITAPGTVEGGDVAWLDDQTLAVGRSYRTNEEGIRQLRQLLNPLGVEVLIVPLPHYRGENDVFHLMSIFSPVDRDLAVVYSSLMPIVFRDELMRRGYSFVEVPDEEFESMGCNVLAVAPRNCIMMRGNTFTKKKLEEAGCTVLEYDGMEISLKGGGGPTCLTRPLRRIKT